MSRAGFARPEIITLTLHIVDIDKKQCAMYEGNETASGGKRARPGQWRGCAVGRRARGAGRGGGGRRRCAPGWPRGGIRKGGGAAALALPPAVLLRAVGVQHAERGH